MRPSSPSRHDVARAAERDPVSLQESVFSAGSRHDHTGDRDRVPVDPQSGPIGATQDQEILDQPIQPLRLRCQVARDGTSLGRTPRWLAAMTADAA